MKLKAGQTLASAVDATNVIVIRAPESELSVTCGGVEMVDPKAGPVEPVDADPTHLNGTQLGKRYVDDSDTVELLCTKPGEASLALHGAALSLKEAKPLPASD